MSLGSDYIADHIGDYELECERIRRKASEGIWVTGDGRHIPVSQMTTKHITSTINYIKRTDKTDIMTPWLIVFENELARR